MFSVPILCAMSLEEVVEAVGASRAGGINSASGGGVRGVRGVCGSRGGISILFGGGVGGADALEIAEGETTSSSFLMATSSSPLLSKSIVTPTILSNIAASSETGASLSLTILITNLF